MRKKKWLSASKGGRPPNLNRRSSEPVDGQCGRSTVGSGGRPIGRPLCLGQPDRSDNRPSPASVAGGPASVLQHVYNFLFIFYFFLDTESELSCLHFFKSGPKGLYMGRMQPLLVLRGALHGMVLALNHPAPREPSSRGFWWPELPCWAGWRFE